MKKLYEKPTIELVVFNYADVMAASGDPLSTWIIDTDSDGDPTGIIEENADWQEADEVKEGE